MIEFSRHILPNGLTLIVHQDFSTPIAAVNMLYKVGSKHEHAEKTGFAHLFEHLMFGGSENIPVYDEPLTAASGENNAFTNNDITNYYITLPAENIETAFWLESDRMLSLAFSEQSLNVQKKVVVEEFNQHYLNQPYGDVWLLLRPLAYAVHPYSWPTIGKSPEHIQNATLIDVKDFFYHHYAPNNAILTIAGPVEPESTVELVQKWFGEIERRALDDKNIPVEPKQESPRFLEVSRNVPFNAIYKVYHICRRNHPDFAPTDLISDILSNGKSARLYQHLVKEKQLFSNINAFVTGDIDEGLLVVTGQLFPSTSFRDADESITSELEELKIKPVSDYELEKVKNRFESNFVFEETSILNKAINLSFYEQLGNAGYINQEVEKYRAVSTNRIMEVAREILSVNNCSTLYYKKN